MTINHVQSNHAAFEPVRGSSSAAGSAKLISSEKKFSQHVALQGKDASDVSRLSRLLAKTAQNFDHDLKVRPNKIALARELLEKGDPLSDQDIDATWDKMFPLV